MGSDRLQLVEQIYHSALEQEESRRAAFLEHVCAGDRDLQLEVGSLLSYGEQAGRFISQGALAVVAGAIASDRAAISDFPDQDHMIGKRISQYRITAKVGSGGMGDVYRAVRADDAYQKYVALKLISQGRQSSYFIHRFKTERQILANLDHPNIARLLDGGTTDDGIPYLVMEYIEGESITAYCDQRRLSIADRLKLFLHVCSAVHYAHQHSVIHRDIKPDNILVTADGVAKLTDFGIAKILGAHPEFAPRPATTTGTRAFTPAYASPEQVKGEAISPASDVYSLGVVLYELFTGYSPYRTVGSAQHEIARAICEVEPEKPSVAAALLGPTAAVALKADSISECRNTTSANLRRTLAGDLDQILLKALRKEPQSRYPSPLALADDLQAFTLGLPVSARRGTFRYRAGKLVKRKRRSLALTAGLALMLTTGMVALWWFTPLPPPAVIHTDQVTVSGRIDTPVRPVSDGKHIFYIERDGGHWNLMRTSIGEGDGQRVNFPATSALPIDIVPNKSAVLIGSFEKRGDDNQLWTMPIEGGIPKPLASSMKAGCAMYSADGSTLAFVHGDSIWLMDSDGSHPRKLSDVSPVSWLAWAPDGKRLRFTVGNVHGGSIWEISREGTGLHEVLADWRPGSRKCCGVWTPDGRYFVFSASFDGKGNVWAVREHGVSWRRSPRGPFQLTSGAPAFAATLDLPGEHILYYTGALRDDSERLDMKTGTFSPLPPNARARLHSFSRDGKWISYLDSRGSLVRSRIDGSETLLLAPQETYHPAFQRWSPDGKWIVFGGILIGQRSNSFLVPALGGVPEPVLSEHRDIRDADWSHDGRKLVLSRALGPKDSDGRELVIVDFETRHPEKLPGSENLAGSRWSPDGRYIAATADDQSQVKLWDFSSKKWAVIARGQALGLTVWSPDSRYLYFQDLLSPDQSLRRYDVRSTRVELVTDFSKILRTRVAYKCGIVGITPDGAPIIDFYRTTFDLFADTLRFP